MHFCTLRLDKTIIKTKEIITMNKFKQIAALILIFLGWMFVVSGVGWIMMKGWLFVAIFTPIGAVMLYFGKKLNEPFAWAAKVKKIERKRKIADERKTAFESRQSQQSATSKHADDDLRAKLLEREQEKLRKQEKDT